MATKGKFTLTESEIHDLFVIAVAHINDPDPEDSCVLTPAWDAIATLHRNGDEAVLDICKTLCKSDDSDERAVGAAVLGQLGYSLELFRDERFGLLKEMLDGELSGGADPEMLASICFAFGHLNDPRAVPAVVPLARHPLSSVRYAVVQALSAQEDALAIPEQRQRKRAAIARRRACFLRVCVTLRAVPCHGRAWCASIGHDEEIGFGLWAGSGRAQRCISGEPMARIGGRSRDTVMPRLWRSINIAS